MNDLIVFDGALGTFAPTEKRGEFVWQPRVETDDVELGDIEDDEATTLSK